jgi:hypothetical protein
MSETKTENTCIQKALPDEALFVLMTRDAVAPRVIVEWIKESILTQPADKLHKALDCAITMAQEQEKIRLAAERRKEENRKFKIGEEF